MANELKYGALVNLQNAYANWTGGFLDVADNGPTGTAYEVSTSSTATRAGLSGTWKIASVTGKADGAIVTSGDLIYLVNQYDNKPSYLDVAEAAKYPSGKYGS
ncbi:hypothetical protein Srufu_014600 [Streptomyces libani subsp. rufus]|nr:hypothetical protein Srufu_014600 [Streptomyces libani subsp. rufus]